MANQHDAYIPVEAAELRQLGVCMISRYGSPVRWLRSSSVGIDSGVSATDGADTTWLISRAPVVIWAPVGAVPPPCHPLPKEHV